MDVTTLRLDRARQQFQVLLRNAGEILEVDVFRSSLSSPDKGCGGGFAEPAATSSYDNYGDSSYMYDTRQHQGGPGYMDEESRYIEGMRTLASTMKSSLPALALPPSPEPVLSLKSFSKSTSYKPFHPPVMLGEEDVDEFSSTQNKYALSNNRHAAIGSEKLEEKDYKMYLQRISKNTERISRSILSPKPRGSPTRQQQHTTSSPPLITYPAFATSKAPSPIRNTSRSASPARSSPERSVRSARRSPSPPLSPRNTLKSQARDAYIRSKSPPKDRHEDHTNNKNSNRHKSNNTNHNNLNHTNSSFVSVFSAEGNGNEDTLDKTKDSILRINREYHSLHNPKVGSPMTLIDKMIIDEKENYISKLESEVKTLTEKSESMSTEFDLLKNRLDSILTSGVDTFLFLENKMLTNKVVETNNDIEFEQQQLRKSLRVIERLRVRHKEIIKSNYLEKNHMKSVYSNKMELRGRGGMDLNATIKEAIRANHLIRENIPLHLKGAQKAHNNSSSFLLSP